MDEQAGTKRLTIDGIAGIQVSENTAFNEIRTLQSLALGLNLLAQTVWSQEEKLRKEEDTENVRVFKFGHRPGVDRRKTMVLPCYFHWFGVSVCNFARLVGFVAALESGQIAREDLETAAGKKKVSNICDAYVASVAELAAVLVWRNKVAAHFAITAPRKDDNPVTLDVSVMHPVSFADRRYRVGAMSMARSTGGADAVQSELPSWSLTEVYERLAPRYWAGFSWSMRAGTPGSENAPAT